MSILQFDCRFRYPSGFSLDFSFSTESGVTALVGPSGCGKTTVLNLIAGILTPNDGRIALHDRELFDSKKRANLLPEERRVGYVFQDYQLFPHLTVRENLQYGQVRSKQKTVEFDHVIEAFELIELLGRLPLSLSGGQSQRVALGRAILCSPQLLLLDEPLSALDAELRENVRRYLVRAVERFSIPTVLVSHDQESIKWLAQAAVPMASSKQKPK